MPENLRFVFTTRAYLETKEGRDKAKHTAFSLKLQ